MCDVLHVSRSGYYKWIKNRDGVRKERHCRLKDEISQVFDQSRCTYGVRRIHAALRRKGLRINKKVVERLMREHGIRPKRKRRFRHTTDSKHSMPVSSNELNRKFYAEKPDQAWVGDITYIDTQEGWLYLATFIDLFSRKVVGWSMSENMTADLVVSAFEMGIQRRGIASPGLVHSDRGSQYASDAFRKKLKKHCKQSMSRKGNCWDNAVAESFFGALKSEMVHRTVFKTRKEAEMSIFEYIEIFYNKSRLHSALGYVSPDEYEEKSRTAA